MACAIILSTSSVISRIAVRVVLINAHGGGRGGGGREGGEGRGGGKGRGRFVLIVLSHFAVHVLTNFDHQPFWHARVQHWCNVGSRGWLLWVVDKS